MQKKKKRAQTRQRMLSTKYVYKTYAFNMHMYKKDMSLSNI